ncbi:MAG TPA: plasmid stabilization protein [Cellvibrio sp.]|nr:plasmid stabilization protein [Cellvibrio sp.]
MFNQILADTSISVSDLKKNPMGVLEAGSPVAVLHHNKPAYYCVPSNVWEAIIEQLEDMELKALVEKRESRPGRTFTRVNIDDL